MSHASKLIAGDPVKQKGSMPALFGKPTNNVCIDPDTFDGGVGGGFKDTVLKYLKKSGPQTEPFSDLYVYS